jgi:hypothetical protein
VGDAERNVGATWSRQLPASEGGFIVAIEQTAEVMKELRAFIPTDIGARAASAHVSETRAE